MSKSWLGTMFGSPSSTSKAAKSQSESQHQITSPSTAANCTTPSSGAEQTQPELISSHEQLKKALLIQNDCVNLVAMREMYERQLCQLFGVPNNKSAISILVKSLTKDPHLNVCDVQSEVALWKVGQSIWKGEKLSENESDQLTKEIRKPAADAEHGDGSRARTPATEGEQ